MFVRHLSLADFRSYAVADVVLSPGVTTLVGPNGQGKTNLVEAIGYVATLASHRVATDAPLVRLGTPQAVIRAVVVRQNREALVELLLTPGRANRARLNRAPVARPRDVLGTLRSVLFAPEDLALVKGDPSGRRGFLDDLLVARQPRWAAVRADYERVLRQRNALLKSAAPVLRRGQRRHRPAPETQSDGSASALHTLDVWNTHLAHLGAELLHARLRLVGDLTPYLSAAYESVSATGSPADMRYRASLRDVANASIAAGEVPDQSQLHDELLASFEQVSAQEIERGVSLVGPHRDELTLSLGPMPAKGYASQGEAWSLALGLKLAAYQLLRADLGEDPVLILDDVFSELDTGRRERLAALVGGCEQVLVTAAVEADVPATLRKAGVTYAVTLGEVARVA